MYRFKTQQRLVGVVNAVNEVMDQEGRTGRALLRSRDLFILEPAAVTSFTLIPPVDRSSLRLRLLLFFRVFTRKKISAILKKKKSVLYVRII